LAASRWVFQSAECVKPWTDAVRCSQSDRPARDALREATSTSVSPAVAQLTLALTQLAMNAERALATSAEQDERSAVNLRESLLRLREAEDDRKQVSFELAQEHDARLVDASRSSAQVVALELQLRELTRTTDDVLTDTRREREQELQAALSAFEAQQGKAGEQRAAIERGAQRAGEARIQREADDRKRKAGPSVELRDLLARYDDECAALDERIDLERRELARIDEATCAIAHHFERIDADRIVQLDEAQALERAERARKLRELNLFGFVQRLQAVVRGFLARKQVRLALLAAKKSRRKKGGGKKSPKKKRSGSAKPGKRAGVSAAVKKRGL
jgi:hypothetical protein